MTTDELDAPFAEAKEFVAAMPPWKQNFLVLSSQAFNSTPREPIIREKPEEASKVFDIDQVITDHINSITEPGVRDWLTKLHEAKAFYFSVDAAAYYQYQQQDWGCLSYGEMKHILGVLEAIERGLRVDAFRHLAQLKVEHEIRTYCIGGAEDAFPSISVGGLVVDAGLYKAGDTNDQI